MTNKYSDYSTLRKLIELVLGGLNKKLNKSDKITNSELEDLWTEAELGDVEFETVEDRFNNGVLKVENGGTGASNASDARANLGITPANIGAAPAGFGLGDRTENISNTDLNDYKEGGFYAWKEGMTNAPCTWGHMLVIPALNGYSNTTQIVWNSNGEVCTTRSVDNSNVWGEWEYVNPPMNVGVEYRTTERFNGKPVYTQLINCGIVSDGDDINLNNVGLTSAYRIIRQAGTMLDAGLVLPYGTRGSSSSTSVDLAVNDGAWHAYPYVGSSYSGKFTLMLQVWYVTT